MICPLRVVPVASMGGRVVRRKRRESGTDIPRHLWADCCQPDPMEWRRQRYEWSRRHDWGPQMLGHLAFFDETVYWHRTALGLKPPIGCVERHEQRMLDAR